jgi:hypothetical protein
VPAGPHDIWVVPAYLPYVQRDLTDAAVAEAEEIIGHALPRAYLELLRVQNGGYIRYRLEGEVHRVIAGIGSEFPNILDVYWEDDQEYVDFPLEGLVPFDGDGHWHLCFDYRDGRSEPSISHVNVEVNSQERIADSFKDYLGMLILDLKGWFVFPGIGDIQPVKDRLSKLLKLRFEPPSAYDNGFEVHRAPAPRLKSEWMWLSPNTVPRAFVREDHARYHELVNRMPGMADRYPGLPAGSWLLSTTDEFRLQVLEALARADLQPQPLSSFVSGR